MLTLFANKLFQFPFQIGRRLNRVGLAIALILFVSACSEQNSSIIDEKPIPLAPPIEKTYGYKAPFSYPGFSGEYQVSSHTLDLIDFGRTNPFVEGSVEPRKLQVRFYYPSQTQSEFNQIPKLPVIESKYWEYFIGHQQVKGKKLLFDNYYQVDWNLSLNQKVDQTKSDYPILIFSHGYGYNPESYTALSAELASLGYIVVSINHTYGANPTLLKDFEPIWAKELPKDDLGAFLSIWSSDQSFVIDQLSLINSEPNSLFFQKLDLANLGIFGHSYGGAAAYHTAANDPRIKALIDIDGTIFNFEHHSVVQPFAFVLSKDHQPKFDYQHSEGQSFELRFNDFEHISFTDHILWWQWDHGELDLGLGNVNGYRAVELTTEIVDDFFGHFLLSKDSQWFQKENINTDEISLTRKN